MANFGTALNINNLGTAIILSSGGNCSAQLAAGTYAVWSTVATSYITTAYSTSLTVSTGLPVLITQPPTLVNVAPNGQIFGVCAAASSAVLSYALVG